MNMRKMIYKKGRIPPVRLADGVYRGVPFYVLSLGTHPCAYVDIAPLGLYVINERDIDCHGGITYHHDHLATVDHEGNFLGWDYAHCMDWGVTEEPQRIESGMFSMAMLLGSSCATG